MSAAAHDPRREGLPMDTVVCADALAFLRGLPEGSLDMILTSPPYDNLRKYNGYSWDFEGIAHEMYRTVKPGGVAVWVVGDSVVDGSETLTSFEQAIYFKKCVGFRVHDTMIWRKLIPGKYPKRYAPAFEYMFILSKGEVQTFNPLFKRNKRAGTIPGGGSRDKNGFKPGRKVNVVAEFGVMENVWDIQSGASIVDRNGHPAAFPEELARRHIATWTNAGDLVCDCFMGSGTVAKVARSLGRHYIGCDLSQEYVDLANERLAANYTPPLFAL
jgi:DNA modification methylase